MLFVIEGPDGTGKTTQTDLLVARLKREGFPVETVSFPRYETPTGKKVKEYLSGLLGPLETIGAKEASVLYADDRRAAAPEILSWLNAGKMVVANRYVASNMAHQGGKIAEPKLRHEFFSWNNDLEYTQNSLPRPSVNVILSVPYEVAASRVDHRGNVKDIHESNEEHLRRANEVYNEIAALFPEHFTLVSCMDGDRQLSPDEVHERVWSVVSPRLR